MLPLIIAGALAVGAIIAAASSDDKEVLEITFNSNEANNCSAEFIAFANYLNLPMYRYNVLRQTRKVIENKIKDYFNSKNSVRFLGFYIQGSSKHKTIIRKQDDTCDIDLGVYFDGKPDVTPNTIFKNISDLLVNQTIEGTSIKGKCVRVFYANHSHIDLPIYYFDKKENKFYIAVSTSNVWEPTDPKLFTEWLKNKIEGNKQKIRLVKYFKAWADNYNTKIGKKMPSGLAFTIWTMKHFVADERDDISFIKTAYEIYSNLSKQSVDKWECNMPTIPFDNVIDKLNEEQKNNFLKALEELIKSSEKVLAMENKTECMKSWKCFFGKWFPENQIVIV